MANMAYCRFTNTLEDLHDCYHNMNDVDALSEAEQAAREKLIELCSLIVTNYGLMDDED